MGRQINNRGKLTAGDWTEWSGQGSKFHAAFRHAEDVERSTERVSRRRRISFPESQRPNAIPIPWWRKLARFRGGRALIWQPITMPPAIASNPAAELRSGNTGRIATNSGAGVRFATVHLPFLPSFPPFQSTITIHHHPLRRFTPSTLLIVYQSLCLNRIVVPPMIARVIETP